MKRGVLPTGNPLDRFDVPGLGRIEVSVIDAANLCIFVRTEDVGIDPLAGVEELQADTALVDRLEAIRATVSRDIGFVTEDVEQEMKVRVNPLLFAVGAARDLQGAEHSRSSRRRITTSCRARSRAARFPRPIPAPDRSAHRSPAASPAPSRTRHSGERAIAARLIASASAIPAAASKCAPASIRVSNQPPVLESAIVGRTARVIMDGSAYLKA